MDHKVQLENRDELALQEADALLAEEEGRDDARFRADLHALEEDEALPSQAKATAAVRLARPPLLIRRTTKDWTASGGARLSPGAAATAGGAGWRRAHWAARTLLQEAQPGGCRGQHAEAGTTSAGRSPRSQQHVVDRALRSPVRSCTRAHQHCSSRTTRLGPHNCRDLDASRRADPPPSRSSPDPQVPKKMHPAPIIAIWIALSSSVILMNAWILCVPLSVERCASVR